MVEAERGGGGVSIILTLSLFGELAFATPFVLSVIVRNMARQ